MGQWNKLRSLVCWRRAETAGLHDHWLNYDGLAGYRKFEGWSLIGGPVARH